MVKILYDLHIADGYVLTSDNSFEQIDTQRTRLRESIFDKHGISQADFDKSMTYYYRHSDKLHDIYEQVNEKLTAEIKSLGGNDYQVKKTFVTGSDTTDVWNTVDHLLLMPKPLSNKHSFQLQSDTAHRAGDKYELSFRTQYILQDGMRDAVAILAVRLENDSIMSAYQRITSDTEYHISIDLPADKKAKQIYCTIYIGRNGNNDSRSTLKLLNVYHISLLRIHRPKVLPVTDNDSISTPENYERLR